MTTLVVATVGGYILITSLLSTVPQVRSSKSGDNVTGGDEVGRPMADLSSANVIVFSSSSTIDESGYR